MKKGNIFPGPSTPPRKFIDRFFWDLVERQINVGSKKSKNLERTEWTTAETMLHNILCQTDGQCDDYGDFDIIDDKDDDSGSNMSSVFTRNNEGDITVADETGPDDEVDWENLNDKDRDTKISDSLKHLGNVKKKKMSNMLLCDMLGEDGLATLKDIKKKREKHLAKEVRKMDMIHLAVRYFEERMKKRRTILLDNLDKSKKKTYSRRVYSWQTIYDAIILMDSELN